jgi:hypothetical protein
MMEKIIWTDRVRNNKVLRRDKEDRNIIYKMNRRKANLTGHILCRNCILKHIVEEKIKDGIEVTGRRRKRSQQILNDLKETRGY